MKKLLLSLAMLALIITATQAQDSKSKMKSGKSTMKSGTTTFSVLAGIGMSKLTGDDDAGKKLDTKFAVKAKVGVNAQIPLSSNFFWQPGLTFATKGAQSDKATTKTRVNLFYLDVPLDFVYKTDGSKNGRVIIGFGPYVGFGIGGKVKYESTPEVIYDVEYRGTVKASDPQNKAYFKRFDGGADVFVGYEWMNGLSFNIGGQVGLTDMNPTYEGTTYNNKGKTHNLGFGLTLAKRFGK